MMRGDDQPEPLTGFCSECGNSCGATRVDVAHPLATYPEYAYLSRCCEADILDEPCLPDNPCQDEGD